jgi:hypothetical protein
MTTLFIICGALLLAVIGRAVLDAQPASDRRPADDRAIAEEQARMMETMAMSAFRGLKNGIGPVPSGDRGVNAIQ